MWLTELLLEMKFAAAYWLILGLRILIVVVLNLLWFGFLLWLL